MSPRPLIDDVVAIVSIALAGFALGAALAVVACVALRPPVDIKTPVYKVITVKEHCK